MQGAREHLKPIADASIGYFWQVDVNVQCYQGRHMTLMLVLGIVGSLVFILGGSLAAAAAAASITQQWLPELCSACCTTACQSLQ